jgi:hypothetical protein
MPCTVGLPLLLIYILLMHFVAYKKLCFCFQPTYKYILYELMLPIGHVPTQFYVNKTYIPHYNMAIIYIYFVECIFFYIFFTFG